MPAGFRPAFEGQKCSLGYELIQWLEEFTCHGPGDVQGEALDMSTDPEFEQLVIDCYELDPVSGRRLVKRAVDSEPKGRAKALALDTPLPTPTGWTTMGQVAVGDWLFDERGVPTRVVGVSDVFHGHDCYEVEFSDGEAIVADAGHRWTVQELRKEYRQVTVDTAYLSRFRTTRGDGAANFRLQLPGPLQIDHADLPIDPYVLGAWLGDGGSRDGRITIADEQIAEEIRSAGYRVARRSCYGPYGYYIHGLRPRLAKLGVLGNKHVPLEFLRGSAAQRVALLQGLMDTDGTIGHDGRASFTSTKRGLAEAVVELVASLGMKCSFAEFRTRMDGKDCGPGWKVDFWPAREFRVFRLVRKFDRQRPARTTRRLSATRRVTRVGPVPSVPTRCVAVDSPSNLFLAGRRMVQTHNSERAGLIGVAEALAPVRFDGWDADGQPVGRPVTSPFIRCLATEEKQSGNTFQNLAFVMGEWGHDTHPEIYGGIRGIGDYRSAQNVYLPGGGECRSSSSGSASKDGGKETFVVPDEVHLYVLPELRSMYATVMRNLPKRKSAEPWALLTTTACKLGEQSVWETLEKLYKQGKLDKTWLVHHREAKGKIDILDKARTIRQLLEVYGPAMHPVTGWMDPEDVYRTMLDPNECRDEAEAARYYLNRSMAGSDAWISKTAVEAVETNDALELVEMDGQKLWVPPDGTAISMGLDGSLNDDSTVLRGCTMDTGTRFTLGIWEKPEGAAGAGWEVPRREVLDRFRWAMGRFTVSRAYCDPHEWRTDVDDLTREFGDEVVLPWATSRDTPMAAALDRLRVDIIKRVSKQSKDAAVLAHYGNAYQRRKGSLVLVRKEYPNSPRKIDAVASDALAYQARADAIADGWDAKPTDTRVICWT